MKRHDRCSVRLVSLFAALSVLPALGGCGKEPKDESGAAPAARAPTTPPAEGRTPAPPVRGSGAGDAMVVANERGVGLMGQFAYAPAVDAFTEAVGADGDALDVQVNLAIATFNRQFDGDEEAGLAKLREVLAKEPSHLRAKYCAALLLLRGGEVEPAGKMLVEVAEADPLDPYAAYFAGQSIEAGDQAGALAWYERAMKRDPYLRSAYFRSSSVLRKYALRR